MLWCTEKTRRLLTPVSTEIPPLVNTPRHELKHTLRCFFNTSEAVRKANDGALTCNNTEPTLAWLPSGRSLNSSVMHHNQNTQLLLRLNRPQSLSVFIYLRWKLSLFFHFSYSRKIPTQKTGKSHKTSSCIFKQYLQMSSHVSISACLNW